MKDEYRQVGGFVDFLSGGQGRSVSGFSLETL
jgi:hypothetical protein